MKAGELLVASILAVGIGLSSCGGDSDTVCAAGLTQATLGTNAQAFANRACSCTAFKNANSADCDLAATGKQCLSPGETEASIEADLAEVVGLTKGMSDPDFCESLGTGS